MFFLQLTIVFVTRIYRKRLVKVHRRYKFPEERMRVNGDMLRADLKYFNGLVVVLIASFVSDTYICIHWCNVSAFRIRLGTYHHNMHLYNKRQSCVLLNCNTLTYTFYTYSCTYIHTCTYKPTGLL